VDKRQTLVGREQAWTELNQAMAAVDAILLGIARETWVMVGQL